MAYSSDIRDQVQALLDETGIKAQFEDKAASACSPSA